MDTTVRQLPSIEELLLTNASTLSRRYPVWLCDVWGVVHDGVTAYREAVECLAKHRENGGTVVLITNAPRPSTVIVPQLEGLGVTHEAYDAIVSSGDTTRDLIASHSGQNVFHLGPEKDLALLEGLPVRFTGLQEAQVVLCSGLLDDENETVDDYAGLLSDFRTRDLKMICANPDRVVRRGAKLIPCAGALAVEYERVGGHVEMAGKPFSPIYDVAVSRADNARSDSIAKGDVLAIGDGLVTDMRGAAKYELDALFVVDGIHAAELASGNTDHFIGQIETSAPGLRLAGIMHQLSW